MKKILVIEYDESIAEIFRDFLLKRGYTVDLAFSGNQGLNMHRIKKYDLIILESTLPDMDGLDICHMIENVSSCPVIVTSASPQLFESEAYLKAGASKYFVKPLSPCELMEQVDVCFRDK